jgi:hypothetical protein
LKMCALTALFSGRVNLRDESTAYGEAPDLLEASSAKVGELGLR